MYGIAARYIKHWYLMHLAVELQRPYRPKHIQSSIGNVFFCYNSIEVNFDILSLSGDGEGALTRFGYCEPKIRLFKTLPFNVLTLQRLYTPSTNLSTLPTSS